MELKNEKKSSPDLFYEKKKNSKLTKVMDEINCKYDKNTVFQLSNGIKKKWSIKREKCSKKYTTDWNEILVV